MRDNDSNLVGGPQDGSKVTIGGTDPVPDTVFVGPKYLGDGFAAWARNGPSKRFPIEHLRDRPGRHVFVKDHRPIK